MDKKNYFCTTIWLFFYMTNFSTQDQSVAPVLNPLPFRAGVSLSDWGDFMNLVGRNLEKGREEKSI